MYTPPMKLLNVENRSRREQSGNDQRCSEGAAKVESAVRVGAAARTSSGMRSVSRCANASAVSTRAATIVQPIPSSPTESPESTEVTMYMSPCTMPTSPLALARRSGSMRMVTVVERAMLRMFSHHRTDQNDQHKDPEPGLCEVQQQGGGRQQEHHPGQHEHHEGEAGGEAHAASLR